MKFQHRNLIPRFIVSLLFPSFSFLLISLPFIADATLFNPLGQVSLPQIIGRVIQAFLGVTGSIALVMFILGGWKWLSSGGKPDKIKDGYQTMLMAAAGLLVIFASYAISRFVITALSGAASPS